MAARGVAEWIQSLPVSPASRGVRPENSREPKMSDGSGHPSPGSLAKWHPGSSTWRTSQVCLFTPELATYSDRWPNWGSMRNGELCGRPTWVPRTSESAYSSWLTPHGLMAGNTGPDGNEFSTQARNWPTPQAHDAQDGKTPDQITVLREKTGAGVSNLNETAGTWATPTANPVKVGIESQNGRDLGREADRWQSPAADSFRSRSGERIDEMGLDQQARNWPTPGANDHKGSAKEGQRRGQLDEATEQKFSRPDPPIQSGLPSHQIRTLPAEIAGAR